MGWCHVDLHNLAEKATWSNWRREGGNHGGMCWVSSTYNWNLNESLEILLMLQDGLEAFIFLTCGWSWATRQLTREHAIKNFVEKSFYQVQSRHTSHLYCQDPNIHMCTCTTQWLDPLIIVMECICDHGWGYCWRIIYLLSNTGLNLLRRLFVSLTRKPFKATNRDRISNCNLQTVFPWHQNNCSWFRCFSTLWIMCICGRNVLLCILETTHFMLLIWTVPVDAG